MQVISLIKVITMPIGQGGLCDPPEPINKWKTSDFFYELNYLFIYSEQDIFENSENQWTNLFMSWLGLFPSISFQHLYPMMVPKLYGKENIKRFQMASFLMYFSVLASQITFRLANRLGPQPTIPPPYYFLPCMTNYKKSILPQHNI